MDRSREGETVWGGAGAGLKEEGAGEGLDGVLLGGAGAGRLNKPLRIPDTVNNDGEMTYGAL